MKKMKFNRLAGRTMVTAGFFVGALMAAQTAVACTLGNWSNNSDVTADVTAGGPIDGVARYSGICAMAATGQGSVEDASPGGIDRIRARFYVLAENTDNALIYEGFNGTTSIFTVAIDASGVVSLSGDGISQALSADGVPSNWNSIEIDWDTGADQVSLWVNSDARTADAADDDANLTSEQVVTSVRLGNLNDATGTLNFDAYESRRTTPVGRLVLADANGDTNVSTGDIVTVRTELLNSTDAAALATGNPDCNEDGNISTGDIVCIRNILLGP